MPPLAPLYTTDSVQPSAARAVIVIGDLGDVRRLHLLIARRRHLQRRGQVGPQLKAVHATSLVAFGHLLVHDAAACRHRLDLVLTQHVLLAHAVAVAERHGIGKRALSNFDCFHYAYAKAAGAPLLTLDKRLRQTDAPTEPNIR